VDVGKACLLRLLAEKDAEEGGGDGESRKRPRGS